MDARSYAGNDKPYVRRSGQPRMQRAHFEFIAQQLAGARPFAESFGTDSPALRAWYVTVATFAVALGATNPRFERVAFERACES